MGVRRATKTNHITGDDCSRSASRKNARNQAARPQHTKPHRQIFKQQPLPLAEKS
jgi:hypothetical protein